MKNYSKFIAPIYVGPVGRFIDDKIYMKCL